jgi:uridine kinase
MLTIGIAGGTASGKTSLAKLLVEELGGKSAQVQVLNMDDYYLDAPHNMSAEERAKTNFDHPDAFETTLLIQHLQALKRGETVRTPLYDFERHMRDPNRTNLIIPPQVLIVEGICLLVNETLRSLFDIKVFVEASADIRFIRRLRRDMETRARSLISVCEQYLQTVRPMHAIFVEPTKEYADFIILNDGVALSPVVVQLLASKARSSSNNKLLHNNNNTNNNNTSSNLSPSHLTTATSSATATATTTSTTMNNNNNNTIEQEKKKTKVLVNG